MRQVDPLIYSGVDRAERRRIARGLAKAKELRQRALKDVARLRAFSQSIVFVPRLTPQEALATAIEESTASPGVALLACAACHRPTPLCICVGLDGKPLDWTRSIPEPVPPLSPSKPNGIAVDVSHVLDGTVQESMMAGRGPDGAVLHKQLQDTPPNDH